MSRGRQLGGLYRFAVLPLRARNLFRATIAIPKNTPAYCVFILKRSREILDTYAERFYPFVGPIPPASGIGPNRLDTLRLASFL